MYNSVTLCVLTVLGNHLHHSFPELSVFPSQTCPFGTLVPCSFLCPSTFCPCDTGRWWPPCPLSITLAAPWSISLTHRRFCDSVRCFSSCGIETDTSVSHGQAPSSLRASVVLLAPWTLWVPSACQHLTISGFGLTCDAGGLFYLKLVLWLRPGQLLPALLLGCLHARGRRLCGLSKAGESWQGYFQVWEECEQRSARNGCQAWMKAATLPRKVLTPNSWC